MSHARSVIVFHGDLLLHPVERWLWRVHADVSAVWTRTSGAVDITIPSGFVTDFASVPRSLWTILPPFDGQYLLAAIFHDRLYETQEFPRSVADLFFLRSHVAARGAFVQGEIDVSRGPVGRMGSV